MLPRSHCPALRCRPFVRMTTSRSCPTCCSGAGAGPAASRSPSSTRRSSLSQASLFYACAAVWTFTPPTFVNSLFLALLVTLVFVDYQHQILPNVVTIPGTIAGILLSPFRLMARYRDPLTVAAASALRPGRISKRLLPWVGSIARRPDRRRHPFRRRACLQLVRKRQGLGMGDVKMMAMVGAFLGWRSALLTIFAASLAGSIVGLFLVLFQGKSLQHKLAFGTFPRNRSRRRPLLRSLNPRLVHRPSLIPRGADSFAHFPPAPVR